MKFLILRRRTLTALACALAAAAMFALVNVPAAVEAASSTRQLPIYCVQRDQKMLSISFDAAWGDVNLRHPGLSRVPQGIFLFRDPNHGIPLVRTGLRGEYNVIPFTDLPEVGQVSLGSYSFAD